MSILLNGRFQGALLLVGCALLAGCGGTTPAADPPRSTLAESSDLDAAMVELPSVAQHDQFDVYGSQRAACAELYRRTLWSDALSCSQELWNAHAQDMSVRGKIELLQLMSRIYSVTGNFDEAKSCYTEILRHDRYWLPDEFDADPVEWREPIIAAYRDLGYFPGRRTEFKNLALLDFTVADLTPDEMNLKDAEKALADYITSFLQEAVRDGAGWEGSPLRVVSYRERRQLMGELAVATGASRGDDQAFTAEMVDPTTLARAGSLQAVHAFLQGSIVRINDDIQVAFVITRVETGDKTCGVTRSGKIDDWATAMRTALADCLECATGQAVLSPDKAGPEALGPMQRAVVALTEYHDALALQEEGRYLEAVAHAQAAANLRPGVQEFRSLLDDLRFAQEKVAMSDVMDLPTPNLTTQ